MTTGMLITRRVINMEGVRVPGVVNTRTRRAVHTLAVWAVVLSTQPHHRTTAFKPSWTPSACGYTPCLENKPRRGVTGAARGSLA